MQPNNQPLVFYPRDDWYLNRKSVKSIREHVVDRYKLPVLEIFRTYEGEGQKIGTPRILLRVGGCPIRCRHCDTPQSFIVDPDDMRDLGSIFNEVLKEAGYDKEKKTALVREVSITGGEPMMYPEQIRWLTLKLREYGFQTSLETSGVAIDADLFYLFDYVSLDIKTPGSGVPVTDEMIDLAYSAFSLHQGMQVKVIIADENDLKWVEEKLYKFYHPRSKGRPLIMTPCAYNVKQEVPMSEFQRIMQMIIDWNKGYNIVAIPQIHKLFSFR